MTSSIYIGIDNGTQGTKVIAYSSDEKKILATGYSAHKIIENNEGRREQDPQWWIDAADEAMKKVLSDPNVDPKKVKGIGVSGQQHGCVVLDSEGKVLRPAKLWCDTETSPECDYLTNKLGGIEKVVELIGNSIAAGFTVSKVLWIKNHEPETYEKIKMILLPHDYINYWLTGNYTTDMGDASGTAYFNVRTRTWSNEILNAIDEKRDWSKCLPTILKWNEKAGTVRKEIADKYGFPSDVIVSSGGGDNMMAAIGTGNVKPGVITCSLGTSGTIFSYASSPIVDKQGELAAFCSSNGGWLPLICTMNVTVSTEQVRNLLRVDIKEFNNLVIQAKPGSDGLRLLPYFNGERTPARPRGHAVFSGITSSNFTRENMARCAMEGATMSIRYGIDILERCGIKKAEVRLVGGGSKSLIWRQIIADIFDCPVVIPDAAEAGAMGGVLQAMACATGKDLIELCDEHVKVSGSKLMPIPENVKVYETVYKEYLKLDKASQQL
ncbi:xylulokinase family protein [Trichomonas vaginalis G3]|uniref:glycerol kinase n=1 Tax=Trichomonas vaginalis (strain ATCC PRA-98 / G3) TaxID=412133 RepID=A2EC65_TRIV3|nr:xylulose kinase family [Trichomonas vaginalis G3]EAY09742.1 xylulokinase family protein [Trichomonas vaginalis G3]KAI5550896.1 xylulose kinase family [Trichomonas vaginalis G3]|eukprot:XP_001321965.1 xylulokinase family protein [Trichomonas vaginalis G3]